MGVILPGSGKTRSIFGSPLFWGIAATFVYILGFIAFLWGFANGPGSDFGWNEAGDFFAGAFAPLAFIWLVVAVFLQKSELEAQRETLEQQMEELKLSREELKLNREMLAEQGRELKVQSDSLARQVAVLDETAKFQLINEQLENLLKRAKPEMNKFVYMVGNSRTSAFSFQSNLITANLSNDKIPEACEDALRLSVGIRRNENIEVGNMSHHTSELKDIIDTVEDSPALQQRFINYPLKQLLKAWQGLENIRL